MKKFLFTTFCTVLVSVSSVRAQEANNNNRMITENIKWMQMNGGYPNNINIRAVRDFVKRNKSVTDAAWAVIDDGFVVKYSGNQRHCRTVYSKSGNFLYTIRQFDEAQMPRDVRRIVKSRYFDYTITLVEEIERPFKPLAYYIHMEDATTIVNVQVSDGEIETVEDYIKG